MLSKAIKVLGFASLLTMFSGSLAFADSTDEVWNHHIQAWTSRTVEDIVADYSDQSVLILNGQIFKGKNQIAHVFTQLFNVFDTGVNRIDLPIVLDRFVYITWHFTPTNNQECFGTDTFVIEDGKIVLQTIASPLYDIFPISSLTK